MVTQWWPNGGPSAAQVRPKCGPSVAQMRPKSGLNFSVENPVKKFICVN